MSIPKSFDKLMEQAREEFPELKDPMDYDHRWGNPIYWLWLSLCCYNSNEEFINLIHAYDANIYQIYQLEEEDYKKYISNPKHIAALMDKRLTRTLEVQDYCTFHHISYVSYPSEAYPSQLRQLPDAPIVLYFRGRIPLIDDALCIAIVGTRRMTDYGKRMAFEIAMDLARAGVIVVSGLALGIDGVATAGALTSGGKTISVLGCGLERMYPAEHAYLSKQAEVIGTVVSEYPPGTPPDGKNFPIRNRIISGICQGTLIIEGDQKSGAMITARLALKQGRLLFALPGPADSPTSEAINHLIKNGAKMVTCADDIIYEFESGFYPNLHARSLLKYVNVNIDEMLDKYHVCSKSDTSRNINNSDSEEHTSGKKTESALPLPQKIVAKLPVKEKNKQTKVRHDLHDSPDMRLKVLDIETIRIYNLMPKGKPVLPDELCKENTTVAQVMTALTVLEINRFISSEPGGRYLRK